MIRYAVHMDIIKQISCSRSLTITKKFLGMVVEFKYAKLTYPSDTGIIHNAYNE